MSGGQLVVLDRAGRDVKRFPLAEGLATLGSDPACDIRIMLPTVSPHHATVVVHANQTVVRNVCADVTLVNGSAVSVAALRHGDVIGIGGRALRWDYSDSAARRPQAPEPALRPPGPARRPPGRAARRGSSPARAAPRDAGLQRALEMSHRASMPGSAGGKQVAIVQPQRRDTAHQIDKNPSRASVQAKARPRSSKSDLDTSVVEADNEKTKRKSRARVSPARAPTHSQSTTKATLWIESRKSPAPQRARVRRSGARTSGALRVAVLRRARSAGAKIQGPLVMDHTKQAAIRLMSGHAARSKSSSPHTSSPQRRTNTTQGTSSRDSGADRTVTILEITDSDGRNSTLRNSSASRRSTRHSPKKSLATTSPRKSALKDPSAKRGGRKTESIKFDLSNLENQSRDTDVLMVTDTMLQSHVGASDDDVTLRYSESPSPRRSIHSRSSRILHTTLGTSPHARPAAPGPAPSAPATPRPSRSSRGSLIVQKALNVTGASSHSRRSPAAPRTPRSELESYSIVDLVSVDTDDSAVSASVYDSAGSAHSTAFGTPQYSIGRRTRSTIDPTLVGSSTPYVNGGSSAPRSRSDPSPHSSRKTSMSDTQPTVRSSRSRRSKSLSTPENTEDAKKYISVNSTRISRASRSRSRLYDSSPHSAASPRSSRPSRSAPPAPGDSTPDNTRSPEEPSTPVLSIQSLLDSSRSSFVSQISTRKGKSSFNNKRKTIGGIAASKARVGAKSKSASFSARKSRLRLSKDSEEILNKNDDEIVTPKSAVKLVPEGVKNKHSTAKKPQSKRSIIDDLNESDIVKQLFNSPVKRKLSQSMTEFSRTQLSDDEVPSAALLDHTDSYTPELFVSPISTPTSSPSLEGIKRMFANTSPENDLQNVRGVKRLLRTPRARRSIKNDLTNVSGVKKIFAKSPKNRLSDVRVKKVFALSPKNDLRRVTGVKSLFRTTNKRKSPRNELDDVRGVKRLFTARSPANDLRNVSGVKRTLRRHSPRNELSDVRGLRRVFRQDARNDLSDVSGVEELFNLSNHSSATVSRAESLFDQLIGKPPIKAVYSKTFTAKPSNKQSQTKPLHTSLDQIIADDPTDWLQQELNKRLQIKNYLDSLKTTKNSKTNRSKSKPLHASLDEVTDVDVLLEQELNKEQQINDYLESMRSVNESRANKSKSNKAKGNRSGVNKSKAHISKANVSRELQNLVTETVEGDSPLRASRARSSTTVQSIDADGARKKSAAEVYGAHTLPIKKRSLAEPSLAEPSLAEPSLAKTSLEPPVPRLPLKKRVVVHSTPLKARLHVSMNARVSPIRADDDTSIASAQTKETTDVRVKSTRVIKANTDNAPEFVKPSPRKTRGRATAVSSKVSPVKGKATKTKKATPVKSKKASPAKTKAAVKKDSPIKPKKASPKKPKETNSKKSKKASPTKPRKASPTKSKKASPVKELASPVTVKTTRSRRKDVSTLQSNTKKRGAVLVVAKKSPVLSPKPRASRKRKEPEPSTTPKQSPKKTRATRKNESVKDDKPKTPKNTRTKVHKATLVVSKPSPQLKPRAARRARAGQSRGDTRNTIQLTESPKKSQVTSSKARAADVQPKTRGRKAAASVSQQDATIEKPQTKTKKTRKVDEPANKKTTSNKERKSVEEPKSTRTRRKKVESQESEEPAPTARARRATNTDTLAPEHNTRKRKTTAPDNEIPPKLRKSKEVAERGRKRRTEVNTEKNTRKNESEEEVNEVLVKVTRGRKAAKVEPERTDRQTEQKTTRGRKANIENVPDNQVSGKRKRTAIETSPVKERKTRVTRGNTQPEDKPAGRARRR